MSEAEAADDHNPCVMAEDKLNRLLKLLAVLQTGRPSVETLCTVCNVHRRTVFRDLETLKRCGFVINFDKGQQRYSVVHNAVLPELQLTLDEAIALITLCFESGDEIHIPFFQAARSAAIKLQGLLPPSVADQLGRIGNAMRIKPEPVNPLTEAQTVFEAIRRAHQRRCAIRITYKSPVQPEIRTLLHPYHLLFNRRSWYVIARSSLHREVRTFHVGRIVAFEETDTTYQIPRGFTLQKYFRNAWNLVPESGPDHEVVVRFSSLVGQNVAEVAWHPTQRVLTNEDGSVDFHVTVSGLNEISWWILGYGKEAEVLQPPALRELLRNHVAEMTKRYSS